MTPDTPENQNSDQNHPAHPAKRRHIPCLFQGCVGLFTVGVFASVFLPFRSSIGLKGRQMTALEQARSIGLALKLFASDNGSQYPSTGVPVQFTRAPINSNEALASLFPNYVTSEEIFGNPLSAYQTRRADNVIDHPMVFPPVKTLEPGENVYGYVMGLTEKSSPLSPLVVDGTDGTGHYRTDPKSRGGVWKGERAIVIRLDNSGALETLQGPANARFIATTVDGTTRNLLEPVSLGPGVRLLDPAVSR